MPELTELFARAVAGIRDDYLKRRNALSYQEYLAELAREPHRHLRDAAGYLVDAIDHFGRETVVRPWGEETRYRIFDQEFSDGSQRLVGQEAAQTRLRAALAAQVREGRINRMIVIHGPHGSAKSTLVKCLVRGLEHYSRQPEGWLWRLRWVFPTKRLAQGAIGFGQGRATGPGDTFAHLDDEQVEAVLECELRDHPLLILPKAERRVLMEAALDGAGQGGREIPRHFLEGSLCHRCRQVADALLRSYSGDLARVLAHVQVERWAMSRRYRRGLVQVGPQLSVDAGERQITADRSLGALPAELQNMSLFETYGPLVDGAGGLVEFEDMLKRPLDAYKYLLNTIETGEAHLGQSILQLNTVLVATTNDEMLEAFREHHDYPSFRDRLTLVPVPYLRDYGTEGRIYELQIVPHLQRHVAPRAVEAVARFAVLTRLSRPDASPFSGPLAAAVAGLTPADKTELYERGAVPEELGDETAAELRAVIGRLREASQTSWAYEGRYGASTRTARQVLLDAALDERFPCLSPFAVVDQLARLVEQGREQTFLDREVDGGYGDAKAFVGVVAERLLDGIEADLGRASGLVDEAAYVGLLERYVGQVGQAVRGETARDAKTGADLPPDEALMKRVEADLGVEGAAAEFRSTLISRVAAWSLEHPRQKLDVGQVFPGHVRRLRDAWLAENRRRVARQGRLALSVLAGETEGLDAETLREGRAVVRHLVDELGYCERCARDALGRLFAARPDRLA